MLLWHCSEAPIAPDTLMSAFPTGSAWAGKEAGHFIHAASCLHPSAAMLAGASGGEESDEEGEQGAGGSAAGESEEGAGGSAGGSRKRRTSATKGEQGAGGSAAGESTQSPERKCAA